MLSDNTYGADTGCTLMQHNSHQHTNTMLDQKHTSIHTQCYNATIKAHKHKKMIVKK